MSVAFALRAPTYKLRSQVCEVLAALCVLSLTDGHQLVCSALSELRIITGSQYRFALLVNALRPSNHEGAFDTNSDAHSEVGLDFDDSGDADEAAAWESRASIMVLINAISSSPQELEQRIALRDEFARRGLNEVMVALRYLEPPDALLVQLQLYQEEKQEDLEEARERAMRHFVAQEDEGVSAQPEEIKGVVNTVRLIGQDHPELLPSMLELLQQATNVARRDADQQLKLDVFYVVNRFAEHALSLHDFDDGWKMFMKSFLFSIQHLVGKQAVIKANRMSDTSSVPTSFVEELELLRTKVEQLSDERTQLKTQLQQKTAEYNTLRSLPASDDEASRDADAKEHSLSKAADKDGFSGVIQRLVQKEKQVLELQEELDRLNSSGSTPRTPDDGAKRDRLERNKQWSNLMEEIARHKATIADLEGKVDTSEREQKYLKRALEAVYGRFQAVSNRRFQATPRRISQQSTLTRWQPRPFKP